MERLTISGTKEAKNNVTIRQVLDKLSEYEDLEDRLNGISIEQVINGFIKTVEGQTHECYKHGRILTNAEADKWNDYKQLEGQGLLMRLHCKVGDTVWYIDDDNYPIEAEITRIEIKENYILYFAEEKRTCETIGFVNTDFGKNVFLTQAEAERKLKEMEDK